MLRKEEEFAKKREIEKKRELKRIANEARQKEIETAAKMEANRKKTEALLEAQVKLAEDNRIIMLQKEAKVRKQLEDKKAELAKAIQDKKDAGFIFIFLLFIVPLLLIHKLSDFIFYFIFSS